MSKRKNETAVDSGYIGWLVELSTAPGTQELREAVQLDELDKAEQELEDILADIDDIYMQRRFKAVIRNALNAREKMGFCVGHLSHERGF